MVRDTDNPPSSQWSSSLPSKIAAGVLRRLPSHVDRVRFAAVCRTWRAATEHQPRATLPWLALPDGMLFGFPGSAALRFPDAAGYHGSCDDWLIFNGDGNGYLLANPFSGDTVRLPGLSCVRFVVNKKGAVLAWRHITDDRRAPRGGSTVRKMVMCQGQVVAGIVGDGRLGKIAMCRPDVDSWVISGHDAWRGFTDIAFYDGKVYAVEDTGDLFAMPAGEDSLTGEPWVAWARCVIKAPHAVPARRRKQAPPAMRYLCVSGGRLLMVHRVLIMGDASVKFTVFKADLVSSRWLEIRSVGDDTALFVGRWCTLARRVSQYELPGNRIHFLDDDAFPRGCPDRFGSYDMRDGKTYPPLLPPLELCNGAGDTPATWLFPREPERVFSWCHLPSDVFGFILRHFRSREERFRLSEVCHDWCASTRQHFRRRPGARAPVVAEAPAAAPAVATTVRPPAVATVAFLALPNGRVFGYPELTSRLFKNMAGYLGAASDDWLLFHDDGIFRLTSPFTGKTRLLPSFHNIRAHDWPVEIVNEPAPSHPAVATRAQWWRDDKTMAVRKLVVCPDGFIAAIFGREHFAKVALCSLETFSWSHSARDRWRWYDDLAFCGGRLYAITAGEDLLALDVGVDGGTGEPFVSRVERVIQGHCPRTIAVVHCLVPSASAGGGGALLMVRRWFPRGGDGRSRFTVFHADLAASRWEAVSSLGLGEALFVGRLCSRAVRGRHLLGDQIFFLADDCAGMWFWEPRRRAGHHAAVYDMLDGTVSDILPRRLQDDGPALATWLFPDRGDGKIESVTGSLYAAQYK